jgi:ubiquitin-conjugating enzyme E2 D/E
MAQKRVLRELDTVTKGPPPGCEVELESETDVFSWVAHLSGPEGSPYAGGRFSVRLTFPSDYPFKPVDVKFTTSVYHPNINEQGAVCMDMLKDKWSPAMTAYTVISALVTLLAEPNWNDPIVAEIAQTYKDDPATYFRKAKECVASQLPRPPHK